MQVLHRTILITNGIEWRSARDESRMRSQNTQLYNDTNELRHRLFSGIPTGLAASRVPRGRSANKLLTAHLLKKRKLLSRSGVWSVLCVQRERV